MKLTCTQLNSHACKTYMIGIEGSNVIALIDPVIDQVNDYANMIKEQGLRVSIIIDTHTHADHISGGASLLEGGMIGWNAM